MRQVVIVVQIGIQQLHDMLPIESGNDVKSCQNPPLANLLHPLQLPGTGAFLHCLSPVLICINKFLTIPHKLIEAAAHATASLYIQRYFTRICTLSSFPGAASIHHISNISFCFCGSFANRPVISTYPTSG